MTREYNRKSFAYGVPGLLLWVIGLFFYPPIALIGTVLIIGGIAYYAKSKGRHPLWGLLGLLGIFGFIPLLFFKDYTKKENAEKNR